jgi:integrase
LVPSVDRPREPRRRWRILSPAEIGRVERAFDELIAEGSGEERAWHERARVIWLVLMGAGFRRGELLGLCGGGPPGRFGGRVPPRLRDVRPGGNRHAESDAGERTVALGERLATELFDHRGRTAFAGNDERVFCTPTKGTPFDMARYAASFRLALTKAGITDYVRPFHDGRHTSITNAAAAGTPPAR